MITLSVVDLVLRALEITIGIEEVGGINKGRAVERILKRTGLGPGNPWCAAFVADVGAAMLQQHWPLPKTASCDMLLEFARKKRILSNTPKPGSVFLLMRHQHDAIHTGFVTKVLAKGVFNTVEGNTNPNGGREGYGVFVRSRGGTKDTSKYTFIDWMSLIEE